MRHVILGAGNLGLDLAAELRAISVVEVDHHSASTGFDVQNPRCVLELLADPKPIDVLWYCVGIGAAVGRMPELAQHIHVSMPLTIARFAQPETRVVVFSSDQAADEDDPSNPQARTMRPRGPLARLLVHMEKQMLRLGRGRTTIVRMSSLYGAHKPERTFPGSLLATYGFDREVRIALPSNRLTPTPTRWAAAMLAWHMDELFDDDMTTVHHCAPAGNVSVRDWGTFVLEGLRDFRDFDRTAWWDEHRPIDSRLGCSFAGNNRMDYGRAHWFDCWQRYFRRAAFTPQDLRQYLPGGAAATMLPGEPGKPAS